MQQCDMDYQQAALTKDCKALYIVPLARSAGCYTVHASVATSSISDTGKCAQKTSFYPPTIQVTVKNMRREAHETDAFQFEMTVGRARLVRI